MDYSKCWLNYQPLNQIKYIEMLASVSVLAEGILIDNAVKELEIGIQEIAGISLGIHKGEGIDPLPDGIVLTLLDKDVPSILSGNDVVKEEGYVIQTIAHNIYIASSTQKGILYGVFDFLRRLQMREDLMELAIIENPTMNLRMLNHWDNMDGSIERGYSGESFFFQDEKVIVDERTKSYARMMASIGVNCIIINNVNVKGKATNLITEEYLGELRKISDIFTGYGSKLYLSINFAAPMDLGGLPVADPLDEDVAQWWKNTAENVYKAIPDFGGFLVKADSEFRPGPFTYQRTHADGANVLAKAVAPFGGIVVWRCFVYNCLQDWKDKKLDRARAAYDHFIGLDGTFEDNVILQIKNGPMDFQVREPVSPLFGGLKKTNQMLEVQIAQEYTGQQKHVCYLVPMWKEIMNFNTYANQQDTTVTQIVSGQAFGQVNCGMAGVTNTGNDFNWTGHDLSAANLYGFGRLCWNPELSQEQIAKEWIQLTLTSDAKVIDTVLSILLPSWSTYEKYTSPLGIGWMVNPNHHYGPNVDGYEYDKWGTYHRADRNGIGVDRTIEGTGYTTQYNEPNASMYENVQTCPEELLLFFHHIHYDYKLKTGKTLIQHIYDTHFEGVEEVEEMMESWKSLEGKLDQAVYDRVFDRLHMQYNSSVEWRDRVNIYFYRKSGVDDVLGRKIYY